MSVASVAENLAGVRAAIAAAERRSGRVPGSVLLVAVSKRQPVEAIRAAIAAGQRDFGENYAQELREKMAAIAEPGVRWHFIGRLQRNKVKYVAGKVAEVHGIDGLALARAIDERAGKEGAVVRAMIEVNIGGEPRKSGVAESEAAELVKAVRGLQHLELAGLMTMPPFHAQAEEERPYYRRLRELRDEIRKELGDGAALPELSMGLSHDFEVAIEEGATRVRIGTAIFGKRDYGGNCRVNRGGRDEKGL